MQFFTTIASIINCSDRQTKFSDFETLFTAFTQEDLVWDKESEVQPWDQPSYRSYCEVISPQKLPKRKNLDTRTGQITLLHAIAHIEYSAIDLALDAAYRFRDMPKAYYADWLAVAADEIRHFLLVESLLHELESFYGALPVHDSLFEAATLTQTLVERMAVIPRYMEANGLDANPKLIEKLEHLTPTPIITKMIDALQLILKEEIDHVRKGDRWFEYACRQEGLPKEIYFKIIQKYYPKTFPRMHSINVEARKEAGFSCDELYKIAKVEC